MLQILLCAYVSLVVCIVWEARQHDDVRKIIVQALRSFAILIAVLAVVVLLLDLLSPV